MKHNNNSFSPWHTKEQSFDSDHEEFSNLITGEKQISKKERELTVQKSIRKHSKMKTTQREGQEDTKIIRSYSKTESLALPKDSEQNFNLTQLKSKQRIQSGKKSKRTERESSQVKNEAFKLFEDEKWKTLTFVSNEKFGNDNSEIRKYQKFVEELKSRRSKQPTEKPFGTINVQTMREKNEEQENPLNCKTINPSVALQEVSIKNFIIHGHYADTEFLPFQNCVKRRDINFALKQKFCSARKKIATKENEPEEENPKSRKTVMIRGKSNKEKENLFNVIKLEKEINNGLSKNKMR